MGTIKNWFKKILPPPVNSFMREVNRIVTLEEKNQALMQQLLQRVELLEKESTRETEVSMKMLENELLLIQAISKEVGNITKQNDDFEQNFVKGQKNILERIDGVNRKIEEPVTYNNNWERRAIESFRDITKHDNFLDDFQRLIKNLDEESVLTVIQLLKRQMKVIDAKDKKHFIYSKDEQEKIRILREDFDNYKIQLSENVFAYKQYLLPVDHFEASVFYHKHGLEYIENLECIKGKDIIDVGGFIGDSCLILAPLTNKKVYAFESVTENYELLLKTLQLNNIKNVIAEKIALGENDRETVINVAGSCSSLVTPSSPTVEYQEYVQMTTLDHYLEKKQNIDVGLIKVDIEGTEQAFIKGAIETIRRFKPVLLLSIYHNADDFFKIKPMIEELDLGYRFKIYNPIDQSISREVLLIAQT